MSGSKGAANKNSHSYIAFDSATDLATERTADGDNGSHCPICDGTGHLDTWRTVTCPFCNGTAEHTKAAESFMKVHPCQCIYSDRENCPLCKQKCHHSTSNKPKLEIATPPPS